MMRFRENKVLLRNKCVVLLSLFVCLGKLEGSDGILDETLQQILPRDLQKRKSISLNESADIEKKIKIIEERLNDIENMEKEIKNKDVSSQETEEYMGYTQKEKGTYFDLLEKIKANPEINITYELWQIDHRGQNF